MDAGPGEAATVTGRRAGILDVSRLRFRDEGRSFTPRWWHRHSVLLILHNLIKSRTAGIIACLAEMAGFSVFVKTGAG